VHCEIADILGKRVIAQTAFGLGNACLREAEHLGPFVDQQVSQAQRGAGSQRWPENVLRLVGVAGRGQAERKLDRAV
jgi:hypothetical protein